MKKYDDSPSAPSSIAQEPMAAYISLQTGYLSSEAFLFIQESFVKTIKQAAHIFGVSQRTIQDWGRKKIRLNPLYSDTLVELEQIRSIGLTTFGHDQKALEQWMSQPLATFNNKSPIDLLDNTIGRKMVIDILYAYQHGIFA